MKNKKKHSNNIVNEKKIDEVLNVMLIPVSIILVGVLVSVSVLYSANVILERDQLVTKSNLQSVVEAAIKNANLNSSQNQSQDSFITPTPFAVTEDNVDELFKNQPIVLGNRDSKLKFVEFADPSCPFCSLAAGNTRYTQSYPGYIPSIPEIKKLVKNGKAAYTWVYLPAHGNGEVAAHVFYCANEKGKFWEVHDKLMVGEGYDKVEHEVRDDFSKIDVLANYLKDDIDAEFLRSCVTSKKYSKQLQDDINTAGKWGVGGTPTLFVGTMQVSDPDFNSLLKLIPKEYLD